MPRMTTVVLMAGVMLSCVAMARRVVGRVRVMMLGYRRTLIVSAPGRAATGSVPVGVVMMIVRLTHSLTSGSSAVARWVCFTGCTRPATSISTSPEGVEQHEHDSLTAVSGSA